MEPDSKNIRIIYTALIFLNNFAFGVVSNIIWPALVDLRFIYNTSLETINYIGTFSSLGYTFGSLSGFFYKWLNRQLVLSFFGTSLALTIALVPHYKYVSILFCAIALNGISGGSWDSSNNVWLVEMWPQKHAPIIQFSQFMYGLGTIVSPLIAASFLYGDDSNQTLVHITPEKRKSKLWIPFSIAGVIQIIVPIVMLLMFVWKKYKKTETLVNQDGFDSNRIEQSDEWLDQNRDRKTILKLILIALLLATYDAAEIGYFYYSPTMFQYIELKLDPEEASRLLSVLSAAYTFGRFATAFISLKIKPDIILFYHYIIIGLALSMLFLGQKTKLIIYLATVLLGYGFSSMWAMILAFTERHLKLTNRVSSIMYCFAGLICMLNPVFIGPYLEKTPIVLFYFEAIYLSISFIIFIVIKSFYLRSQ